LRVAAKPGERRVDVDIKDGAVALDIRPAQPFERSRAVPQLRVHLGDVERRRIGQALEFGDGLARRVASRESASTSSITMNGAPSTAPISWSVQMFG
jgi:hypothetical protein